MPRGLSKDDINSIFEEAHSKLQPWEIGWLAGIIDGEGTITITPRRRTDRKCVNHGWSVSVRVGNTDPRIIAKICELTSLIGGSSGYVQEKRSNSNRCKLNYYWVIAARAALVFLRLIEPYLIGKREQAKIAIDIQERITSFTGIHPVGRDNNGRLLKGSQLSPEEEAYRFAAYKKIKELNRRGPVRQEAICNDAI